MKIKPANLLIIQSDEHNRTKIGCYGDSVAITPNIDALAKNGTLFENAYCNNPICVPSRASMLVGAYAHRYSFWDNGHPYEGTPKGFGHVLTEQGHRITTIGKLHYRGTDCDLGLPDQRMPLHVRDGVGDLLGSARVPGFGKNKKRKTFVGAKTGESDYTRYDDAITREAISFLENETGDTERPWVLYLGYVCPHFPFTVPEKYYDMYDGIALPDPINYAEGERPMHPVLEYVRNYLHMTDVPIEQVRNTIRHYYAMATFLDDQIGQVVAKLRELGLDENTRIIYTSDHGDMIGDHALFYKGLMYEGSVGVPLIMSGPEAEAGKRVKTPVSLVDLYPTILDCLQIKDTIGHAIDGRSLFEFIEKEEYDRVVFADYHAGGPPTDEYMIRKASHKLVYYPGYESQLFDLDKDPNESRDVYEDPAYADIREDLLGELYKICDPNKLFAQCRREQLEFIERNGGMRKVLLDEDYVNYSPAPKV